MIKRHKGMRKLKTIEMHRMTVEDFKESRKMPLIVVLDDVRCIPWVPCSAAATPSASRACGYAE